MVGHKIPFDGVFDMHPYYSFKIYEKLEQKDQMEKEKYLLVHKKDPHLNSFLQLSNSNFDEHNTQMVDHYFYDLLTLQEVSSSSKKQILCFTVRVFLGSHFNSVVHPKPAVLVFVFSILFECFLMFF